MKYIVDIKGEIEGDYEIIGKYEEKPQGEWNYIQAGMAVCPFCGATPHKQYKNFCPNCGASMMKGGKT